jgi:hypothetical protein
MTGAEHISERAAYEPSHRATEAAHRRVQIVAVEQHVVLETHFFQRAHGDLRDAHVLASFQPCHERLQCVRGALGGQPVADHHQQAAAPAAPLRGFGHVQQARRVVVAPADREAGAAERFASPAS